MAGFWRLLRENRNYRRLWLGQVVSEVGDHFNTIACLSLTLHMTGSGLAVGGVMMARTLPALVGGPLAGVALDRADRRLIMIASDVARAAVALAFLAVPYLGQAWLLVPLSALLVFASPFFTAGRAAILPSLARPEELHTANALTQTTSWLTLAAGAFLGGFGTMKLGYDRALGANALTFLFSAVMIFRIHRADGRGFRAERKGEPPHPWRDLKEGLAYMARTPLVLAIGLALAGWATGGGAMQVLFPLFGEVVFGGGAAAVGIIWGCAGIGLVIGGVLSHRRGGALTFAQYKRSVTVGYLITGLAYAGFSATPALLPALGLIMLSRVAMGANNVLNRTALLRYVPDEFRGRVFAANETILASTMALSMAVCGAATGGQASPERIRLVGIVSGLLTAATALLWGWADRTGRLPEPSRDGEGSGAGLNGL
jgi:predicted MFS family arabinose efflux permease